MANTVVNGVVYQAQDNPDDTAKQALAAISNHPNLGAELGIAGAKQPGSQSGTSMTAQPSTPSTPSVASQINTGTPQTGTTGTTANMSGYAQTVAQAHATSAGGVASPAVVPQSQGAGTAPATNVASQMNAAARVNSQDWVNDPNWQGKLQQMQSNPDLAMAELNRVKSVYNAEAAKGAQADPNRLQQIKTWADQVRQAAGISPDDPFYGNGPAPTADGQLGMNVNGQSKEPVQVYQGTSYDSADKIAQSLGVSYTRDPKTGMPVIGGKEFDAVSFDANGNPLVPTKLVAESLGYSANYDDKSKTVSVTSSPQQSQPAQQPQAVQIGAPPAFDPNAATNSWTSYMNAQGLQQPQLLPIQQGFTPDWQTYYDQAHAQIDPLYQTQLNDLMSKQNSDITSLDTKMNQRGLFTSGIAQAAENDLRAKTTGAVASLFNKQMSDIEKNAQTLYSQAYKAYTDGNNFALKYNQDQLTNYLNNQKNIFNQWLSTQKLDLSQQQYALNAWDKMATLLLNQQKAMLPYQYQTANNAATNQTSMDKALLPWTMGPTPAQKLPYQQQTANNAANNQLQAAKIFGFDENGRPTLDTWKILGYVQMPDGSLQPTEQASNDQRNYAVNMAKTLGYTVDANGKIIPTEQATHDRATEQNAQDANKLKMYDMMGFDKNGVPTLKRDQLNETISKDQQAINTARTNAVTNENKLVVDDLGKQLSAIDGQINSLVGMFNANNPTYNAQLQSQIKTLSTQRDDILTQLSGYSNGGFYSNTGK